MMKTLVICYVFIAIAATDNCKLPNCRRPSSSIPGSLNPKDVPQMIVLTFDRGVNRKTLSFIKDLFGEKYRNPNGCRMRYTFFATDNENDYSVSAKVGRAGHELASHSLTHRSPASFWANQSARFYKKEMVGMKQKLVKFSNVKVSGARIPFLQLGGDAYFKVIQKNFKWDSSYVVGSLQHSDELPIWPFTLDEPIPSKYCRYGNCPKKAYPGLWEFPHNRHFSKKKVACSLVDLCRLPRNAKGIYEFLYRNFYDMYYSKNRAPYSIFTYIDWFRFPHIIDGTKMFLQDIAAEFNNVYVVTVSQAIEWIKNPTPLSEISNFKPWSC